jgi:hypothetical protein
VRATNFLRRFVRNDLLATICPQHFALQRIVLQRFVHATFCPQRFVLQHSVRSPEFNYSKRSTKMYSLFFLFTSLLFLYIRCSRHAALMINTNNRPFFSPFYLTQTNFFTHFYRQRTIGIKKTLFQNKYLSKIVCFSSR